MLVAVLSVTVKANALLHFMPYHVSQAATRHLLQDNVLSCF